MSSESVKVCDVELKQLGELAACWDEITGVLGRYVAIMASVRTESIKDGHIHNAVENLYFYAEDILKYANGLGTKAESTATSLVKKAEDIDLNLYNGV